MDSLLNIIKKLLLYTIYIIIIKFAAEINQYNRWYIKLIKKFVMQVIFFK